MLVKKDILKKIYKGRENNAKKYDYGITVVIGGGEFYTGAPALSGMAAFMAGTDMVHILAPKRAADIIASFSPNLSSYPLEGERLGKKNLAALVSMVKSADMASNGKTAVVIGGGLGRSEETQKTVLSFLEKASAPVVIDADGIYAIIENLPIIKGKNFLLTPNSHEFYLLTGKKIVGLPIDEKIKIGREAAFKLGATILLKGREDIIFDFSGEIEPSINKTGTPIMAKGGTGDTLAGIAGAFIARGAGLFVSAAAAAYLNGKAGELAAKEKGESMLATDLIENIPKAINI